MSCILSQYKYFSKMPKYFFKQPYKIKMFHVKHFLKELFKVQINTFFIVSSPPAYFRSFIILPIKRYNNIPIAVNVIAAE